MIFGHHHHWGITGFLVKVLIVLALLGLLIDCAGDLLNPAPQGGAGSVSAPSGLLGTPATPPPVPTIAPRRPAGATP